MELAISALFLSLAGVILSITAFFLPTIFVCLILFIYCGYLGLIPRDILGVFTTENMLVLASLMTIPSLVNARHRYGALADAKYLALFPLTMLALALFGLCMPTLRGESSLALAFVEGKQFILYVFTIYCIFTASKFQTNVIFLAVLSCAMILAIEVIAFRFTGIYPPGFLPVLNDSSINTSSIHIMYPQVISGALFLIHGFRLHKKSPIYSIFCIPILLAGLLLQDHFSILVITLAVYFAHLTGLTSAVARSLGRLFFIGFILISLVFIQLIDSNPQLILPQSEYILALQSRFDIGFNRIAYFLERPWFGYGFIHEASSLGTKFSWLSKGIHDLRLGTVDSGILDLLLRFGIVGLLIALTSFAYFCRKLISVGPTRTLPLNLLIAGFSIMIVTWSMLSYLHGIIFISIVVLFSLNPLGSRSNCPLLHIRKSRQKTNSVP